MIRIDVLAEIYLSTLPFRVSRYGVCCYRLPTELSQKDSSVMSRFKLGSLSLTQLAYRFNWRTAKPLAPASAPGYDEPTSLFTLSSNRYLLLPEGLDYTFILIVIRSSTYYPGSALDLTLKVKSLRDPCWISHGIALL